LLTALDSLLEKGDRMAVQLTNTTGLQFADQYGVLYVGLQVLQVIPGKGTIWLAIPKFHDLSQGPITPVIVLDPGGTAPVS
jgi:hypothetical protein